MNKNILIYQTCYHQLIIIIVYYKILITILKSTITLIALTIFSRFETIRFFKIFDQMWKNRIWRKIEKNSNVELNSKVLTILDALVRDPFY